MTTILINLTGDYLIQPEKGEHLTGSIGTDPNLHELDAFLGALRGTVSLNTDVFLGSVSSAINQIRTGGFSSISLEITTDLKKDALKHTFKLISHK